jgi:hypothetical protein
MGFNIFLFLFSAYIVYDTTKSGAKMTSCGPKTNFHLYLRLAVIMGLTWVTGLAAGKKYIKLCIRIHASLKFRKTK